MCKEIDIHGGKPAVNIKVYRGLESVKFPINMGRYSEDGGKTWKDSITDLDFDRTWILRNMSDQEIVEWHDITAQDRILLLIEIAIGEFQDAGYHVEIYQAGRSGGWLEVSGLPDIEDWGEDLFDLWKDFENACQAEVEAFPESMAVDIYMNIWEAKKEDERRTREEIDKIWEEVQNFLECATSCLDVDLFKKWCPKLVAKVEG